MNIQANESRIKSLESFSVLELDGAELFAVGVDLIAMDLKFVFLICIFESIEFHWFSHVADDTDNYDADESCDADYYTDDHGGFVFGRGWRECVCVGIRVSVSISVCVGVSVSVSISVGVSVRVGVSVSIRVGVGVGIGISIGVGIGVGIGVCVCVCVSISIRVSIRVSI
jgi:hypothetical protein